MRICLECIFLFIQTINNFISFKYYPVVCGEAMTPARVSFNEPNMFGALALVNIPGLQQMLETELGYYETAASSLTFTMSINQAEDVATILLVTDALIQSVTMSYVGSTIPVDMVRTFPTKTSYL